MRVRVGAAVVVSMLLAWAVPSGAYEQRSGTISFGVDGHLSGLVSSGGDFDAFRLRNGLDGLAPGLAIRFRLSIDRASALGLSFEATDFDRSLPMGEVAEFESASNDTADKIHATIATLDYYRYFWRKSKNTPYLVVSTGFYRPEIRFGKVAASFPGSNLIVSAGIGLEHFFSRSVSLDASFRVSGLAHDGGPSVSSQLGIGIMFYHLKGRRRAP